MSVPSKSLNITVINSFLRKLSTWVTAKPNVSTRIDFLLLTSMKFLRAIPMCSAFSPDRGHDNSTIILIGACIVQIQKVWVNSDCTKKTFQSLGRSVYQCPQCASVNQVRNILFEDQKYHFFLSFGQGFTLLKRAQNQFKMLLEMCIVQHVEMKSVCTFQPKRRIVSKTIRSAKHAATF